MVESPDAGATQPSPPVTVLAQGIVKRFGMTTVLRGVDLAIWPGEAVTLFGPNGAGKTTLLRIVSTLARPSRGRVVIDGFDAGSEAQAARARIGVVAHQPFLYESLTAAENLQFFARMYDVPDPSERIVERLETVGLARRAGDRVDTFSRGMQQRLALARATLHRPSVLLLDEPDTGLDPDGISVLERIVAGHRGVGGSVLLTTHDLEFGLRVSDRALVMMEGSITLDFESVVVDRFGVEQAMGMGR
jgi:heme exporter protein A